jgi:hypothetical protein
MPDGVPPGFRDVRIWPRSARPTWAIESFSVGDGALATCTCGYAAAGGHRRFNREAHNALKQSAAARPELQSGTHCLPQPHVPWARLD